MEKFFLEEGTMFRLYVNEFLGEGETVNLGGEQAFRALSILRLRNKDKVVLFNGRGGEYQSRVVSVTEKSLSIRTEHFYDNNREEDLQVHLIQGISRKDRMQYSVQKSCELGVKSITPIFSEKCSVKIPHGKVQEKVQHWKNIAISASEQSGRCLITEIKEPMGFSEAIQDISNAFIGYPKSKMVLNDYNITSKDNIYIIIGPESGFSEQEYKTALRLGVHSFSMGPRILRSETASVVVLSTIQAIQQFK